MIYSRSGIILTHTLSYRSPTGLSFGSYPFLILHIPKQFHCKHIWRQHTAVCWRYTIISIAVSDRYARTTVITCLSALHSWFCHNGLALNSTKSESILIGTRQRLRILPPIASPIIAGTPVPFSDTIKTLGVTLDQNLTLNNHVSSLSRSIHFYTRALRHIRPAVTESMAASLGASLVQSRLDYANSIMYGMSAPNMHKLQSVQNSLTRVVLPSLRHLSASERLNYLHRLPVSYRIHLPIRP